MNTGAPITVLTALVLAAALVPPAYAQEQSFGIGGRMSMIRADVDADAGSERFTGGHIRARLSTRTAVEVALDRRSETNEAGTARVREYPLQASLLLYPVRSVFAPYLLGGGGWYTNRLDTLDSDRKVLETESTRDFGWHAGFGAEIRLGRHAGAHADYRYTFLDFGDDDEAGGAQAEGEGGFSRFLPSYKGSMWTAGVTLYF
jgi:opacity protein-like surface antigen